MQTARLPLAQPPNARLTFTDLTEPNLSGALLHRADLFRARLLSTDIRFADLSDPNLFGADVNGALLRKTRLTRTTIWFSRLTGTPETPLAFRLTELHGATSQGGMLRFADPGDALFDAETDFRNAFLDDSVTPPAAFRAQMGPPFQRAEDPLDDGTLFLLRPMARVGRRAPGRSALGAMARDCARGLSRHRANSTARRLHLEKRPDRPRLEALISIRFSENPHIGKTGKRMFNSCIYAVQRSHLRQTYRKERTWISKP